jgi:hypothetical protein
MTAYRSRGWHSSRREFSRLALLVPWMKWQTRERKVETTADGEPQFVAPPGEPTEELRRRCAELESALASGRTTVDAVLSDPAADELRPYPLFRETIARHAPAGRVALAPQGEPGVPLLATVAVVRRDGEPYAGVRVYAYQTSAKGWYAAEAPHVSGNSGDYRFARLFTHGRTDAAGRLVLSTIRPAGYPRSTLPSHIHLLLEGEGGDERVTEIRFEDCPRMTSAEREASLRSGFVVVPVETAGGGARCTAEFVLPA